MKTLDMITKQQLKDEYHLSAAYIQKHGREMGGFSKPMIFDRELVELHIREKAWQDRLKKEAKDDLQRRLAADLEKAIRQSQTRLRVLPDKMSGRGGKRAAA